METIEVLRCPKCWERTATVRKKPLSQSLGWLRSVDQPSPADDAIGIFVLVITILVVFFGAPVCFVVWLFQRNRQHYGVCKSCRHQWRLG
ncbi:hypothetical protein [Robbsia sp. KACC 23696]|uniref:hypothetical protein n=1 Tax=Robbsia sp. KACC 23696 TaxID=3149231 RepID=UPI00325BD0BF